MTTSITRFLFVIPVGILICYLAVRLAEPGGPTIENWILQTEVKNCISCLADGDWHQGVLHLSRVLTPDGYILAALILSTFWGVKHYFNESKKQMRAAESEIDTLQSKANRLGNEGLACSESGQIEKAIGYYEQALTISRQIGDRQVAGRTLGNLGNAYRASGKVEKAVAYHKQALAIFREIGDRQGEGSVLGNLGKVYSDCGQMEIAIRYNKQSLLIFEEINSPDAIQMRNWLSELENQSKPYRCKSRRAPEPRRHG